MLGGGALFAQEVVVIFILIGFLPWYLKGAKLSWKFVSISDQISCQPMPKQTIMMGVNFWQHGVSSSVLRFISVCKKIPIITASKVSKDSPFCPDDGAQSGKQIRKRLTILLPAKLAMLKSFEHSDFHCYSLKNPPPTYLLDSYIFKSLAVRWQGTMKLEICFQTW